MKYLFFSKDWHTTECANYNKITDLIYDLIKNFFKLNHAEFLTSDQAEEVRSLLVKYNYYWNYTDKYIKFDYYANIDDLWYVEPLDLYLYEGKIVNIVNWNNNKHLNHEKIINVINVGDCGNLIRDDYVGDINLIEVAVCDKIHSRYGYWDCIEVRKV